MIRHIVMWKFRPGTEAEQSRFFEGLRGLQGVVPQLLRCEVAVNVGKGNYDAVLVSDFESLADLEAYKNDPRHPGGPGSGGLRVLRRTGSKKALMTVSSTPFY